MITVRRIAELLSRGKTYRRRLPARYGGRPLLVSPDAALRWLKPGSSVFEATLLELADRWARPGMVVWDIGANVGAFAIPAAHLSRALVLAVEADPFLAELLRRTSTLEQNRDLDLRVLSVAVSDRDGAAEFAIAGRGRATNGLLRGAISTQHGQTRQVITIATLRIDTLLDSFPAPGLVKIDIEGAELLLLRGAGRLLREVKPVLYIEVNAQTAAECSAILEAAGYRLFDGDGSLSAPGRPGPDTENILALPPDRKPEAA